MTLDLQKLVGEYHSRLQRIDMKNLQVSLLRDEATELRRALRRAVANVGNEKYTEKTRLKAEKHAKTIMRRLIVLHKEIDKCQGSHSTARSVKRQPTSSSSV